MPMVRSETRATVMNWEDEEQYNQVRGKLVIENYDETLINVIKGKKMRKEDEQTRKKQGVIISYNSDIKNQFVEIKTEHK